MSFAVNYNHLLNIRLLKTACSLDIKNTALLSTSSVLKKITPNNLKGKSKGSQEWLRRQLNDPYVKKARSDNYRCRSAYKLLEIDDRYKILKPNSVIIDCGAAPGSWCQVAAERINTTGNSGLNQAKGTIIGVDLQQMEDIEGVHLLSESDFTAESTQIKILEILQGRKVDIILSDMAPKASGIKSMDHDVLIDLCIKVLKFGMDVLRPRATILCKIWMGDSQKNLELAMKHLFETVRVIKPSSSRSDSAEIYLLAENFKPRKKIK